MRELNLSIIFLLLGFVEAVSAQAVTPLPPGTSQAVTPWPTGETAQSPRPMPSGIVPLVPVPNQPITYQQQQGMSPELLAILQSVFGVNPYGYNRYNPYSTFRNNNFGRSEFANSSQPAWNESYSSDSMANVRPTGTADLTSPLAILGPFKKYFDGCTSTAGLGNCKFVNLGVKGDAAHRARRSCHNSSQAIDVGPLTCSSGRKILASDPKYFDVAKCMANQTNNELQVIFYKSDGGNMIQKSDHNNHMHIQLKNCRMVFG